MEAIEQIKEKIKAKRSFVLEAGAGAGKTYALIQTINHLIENESEDLLYKNQESSFDPVSANSLFLPFNDLTNGNKSYGGGRYIDLEIPKENTIVIDFNKAYNPYCAYNNDYSCPIPPPENELNVKINAGALSFAGH